MMIHTAPSKRPETHRIQSDHPIRFIDRSFDLPALPAIVQELLLALEDPDVPAAFVADLLSRDASLAARIMKLVNSSYYGLPSKINNVKHAVAYLGLGEIKRMALTVAILGEMAPRDTAEFERLWQHSLHTALSAKHISRKHFPELDSDDVHVAALLHDLGKLVYMRFFPEYYRRITSYSREHSVTFNDAEIALELPSHAQLGEVLCQRWSLPRAIGQGCLRHELGDLMVFNGGGEASCQQGVICLANLLSNLATEPLAEDIQAVIRREAMFALQCDERGLQLLIGELYVLLGEAQQLSGQF